MIGGWVRREYGASELGGARSQEEISFFCVVSLEARGTQGGPVGPRGRPGSPQGDLCTPSLAFPWIPLALSGCPIKDSSSFAFRILAPRGNKLVPTVIPDMIQKCSSRGSKLVHFSHVLTGHFFALPKLFPSPLPCLGCLALREPLKPPGSPWGTSQDKSQRTRVTAKHYWERTLQTCSHNPREHQQKYDRREWSGARKEYGASGARRGQEPGWNIIFSIVFVGGQGHPGRARGTHGKAREPAGKPVYPFPGFPLDPTGPLWVLLASNKNKHKNNIFLLGLSIQAN
jgi:hypothetical protein